MKQSERQQSGKIVVKYLEKFPDLPSLTLARVVHSSPDGHLFKDLESIRSLIRYYRGNKGKKDRENLTDKRFVQDKPSADNPYSLPNALNQSYLPYIVPSELKRGLIITDIHIPYQDNKVITAILAYAKRINPDFIILNEVLDCYQLSRFCKDPSKPRMLVEIQSTRQLFAILRLEFPNAHITYHLGNHDERMEYYLWQHPELYGLPELRLDNLLDLFNLGIGMVSEKRIIQIGKLSYLHGHEWGNGVSTPVNPARTVFLKANGIAACGHFHRSSEHSETNIKGELITCWSLGCACQLHPLYSPLNRWNHGFAHIEKAPDGQFEFHNIRILDGKIL